MKKRILFLSALALFLSSCGIFSPLSENTGSISIKMPEGSERSNDVSEITSFSVELYNSDNIPVVQIDSAPGKSLTFESLEPGSYAIFIKAFKPTSKECAACGEKSGIIVKAGATTYETVTLKWVITDWAALSAKLSSATTDVGDIYISGKFDVTSAINFSGTVNIIPTGSVTFTRSADCKIFDIASGATLTFAGTDSAPIVFDGNSISSKNPMIYSSGTLTLENCTLQNSNNSSNGSCGALYSNSGTTNITNCTFTSNTGIYGGAVQIYSGTVNISSITCSRNSATSGNDIYNHNGTLNIGGTVSSIDIYMNNSLDAYSPVLIPVKDITLAEGTDTINVTMTTCSEEITVLTQSDGMTTSDFAAAIKCFTLTNDGFVIGSDGKAATTYTVTFILNYAGSINTTQSVTSGNAVSEPEVPTRDGYTFGGWYTDENCTAAYNFSTSVTADIILYAKWTEETASDTVYTDFATLKNAIGAVESGSSGTFYVSGNFESTSSTITVKGDVTVKAKANCTITRLSTATGIALFDVNNGATLTLGGADSAPLTLDGNKDKCEATYPLINSAGNLEIAENCTLQNNNNTGTAKLGGAIYEYCTTGEVPTLTISGGKIIGNSSSKGGGAIYILGGTSFYINYVFSGGTISNNSASANGGALYIKYASGTLSGTDFDRNTSNPSSTSSTGGGAIYFTASKGSMTITGGSITNNTSSTAGGGIYVNTGTLAITGTTVNISDNSCDTSLSNSACIYGSFTLNGTNCTSTSNNIINGVLQTE
ncbi:InlB B-repeat-containing protein [uncultured Treponema sp.]|uniref:InlB B-repeat-containing protein n=2 Tax=uncultured Treponema sp. TaxID=162155 RepID=UPI0025913E31|nr:InlB B-repeat-containing protein [uncultured Treponema sp.]